MKRNTRRL